MQRASIVVLASALLACDTRPPPTWNDDVRALVADKCVACHQAGGVAPFALTTYEDASMWAEPMAAATAAGAMPPWPASDECGKQVGELRLDDAQKEVFARWAEHGAPRGEGPSEDATAPAPEAAPRVDEVLRSSEPYTPRPLLDGTDDYHCFAVPSGLAETRDVVAVDVVPDVAGIVHHLLLYRTTAARAQAADDGDEGPGWTCFGGPGTDDLSLIAAWAPGSGALRFPAGTGIPLEPDDVLVLQIHYSLTGGAAAPDQTAVHLTYGDERVARPAEMVLMVDTQFTVAAGAEGASYSYTRDAPWNATLWGVLPHMHTLGRSVRATVGEPAGCLVDVPSWDFHWQRFYFFEDGGRPVTTGDPITLTCAWDNPTGDSVRFGEATTDEMCVAVLYMTRDP